MFRLFIILTFSLLSACSSFPINWNTNDYTVQSGDTLYSIAWRYVIDPDDLARWNNLAETSLIHAGQRLHLSAPGSKTRANQHVKSSTGSHDLPAKAIYSAADKKRVIVKQNETLYSIAQKHQMTVTQLARYNNIKKPYLIKPGQQLVLGEVGRETAVSDHRQTPSPRQVTEASKNAQLIKWQWPIKGKLIKSFNARLNDAKGIDIAGKEGTSIKAAASGKVVYSGNGLISYGNLIIIKHDELYLSAYAHNRKLLVKEGQQVKMGETIAELGSTGADNPRLHFEIRKNGKPVNPVSYLPSS